MDHTAECARGHAHSEQHRDHANIHGVNVVTEGTEAGSEAPGLLAEGPLSVDNCVSIPGRAPGTVPAHQPAERRVRLLVRVGADPAMAANTRQSSGH